MAKYLLTSDWHLTERAPSSCTDNYLADLLVLVVQLWRVAEQEQADAVVIAGDLFHHKAPSRTSHRLVQTVIGLLRGFERPVYIVPGNHDIANDRLESIDNTQPLGVIFKAGGAQPLSGPPTTAYWNGVDSGWRVDLLYGVPWQQHWSPETIAEALDGYQGGLVVTHAPLYPPGREPFYEHTPAQWWADAMGSQGSLYYGHVHEPHGTWTLGGVQSPTFCNVGALSRGSLHEYNLTRQVGCAIWDSEAGFRFVPLDARPVSEVFRLTEKAQAVDVQGKLDTFLTDIGSTTLEVLTTESVMEHIRSLGLGKDVEDLAAELLEGAGK